MEKKQAQLQDEKYCCNLVQHYLQGVSGLSFYEKEQIFFIEIDHLLLPKHCVPEELAKELKTILSLIEKYSDLIKDNPKPLKLTLKTLRDEIENKYWQRNLEYIIFESSTGPVNLLCIAFTVVFMINKFPAMVGIPTNKWILFFVIIASFPTSLIMAILGQIILFTMVYSPRFLLGEQYSPLVMLGRFIDHCSSRSLLSPINEIDVETKDQPQQASPPLLHHAELSQNSPKSSAAQPPLFFNTEEKSSQDKVDHDKIIQQDRVSSAISLV